MPFINIRYIDVERRKQLLQLRSADSTTRVWDLETRQGKFKIPSLQGEVLAVAFHPDNKRLATSGIGSPVQIWDAKTGREVASIDHKGVQVVENVRGGALLATASPNSVRLWNVSLGQALADSIQSTRQPLQGDDFQAMIPEICQRIGRNLTRSEWNEYIGADTPYRRTCPDLPPGG